MHATEKRRVKDGKKCDKDSCDEESRYESMKEAGGEVKSGRRNSRKNVEGRANRRRKENFVASYD